MNPYKELGAEAYWKLAVAQRSAFDVDQLWQPKFRLNKKTPIVTFGSCFAQHISKFMKRNGFNWLNAETAPAGLDKALEEQFNYGVYSARTGNIYTTTLLLQWTQWALGEQPMPELVWQSGDRYFDPFRPAIEPDGFASVEELLRLRAVTVEAFRKCITESGVFIFTLGLTESWTDRKEHCEYAMCPGTVAGTFDAEQHHFKNLTFMDVYKSLKMSIRKMRAVNPKLKFILTVSPVPLTATMSGKHILAATTHSKSVLRAVAGQLEDEFGFVDYFPSYEIISSPVFGGMFFEPNKRSVNPVGVEFVMKQFSKGLGIDAAAAAAPVKKATAPAPSSASKRANEVCEEQLLDAFAPTRKGQ